MDKLKKQVEELKKELDKLKQKRVYQQDIVPDVVKTRHMGEANRYIASGLEADRPDGFDLTGSTIAYFATDTNKLWIWNGTAYKSVTLS